MKKTTYLLLATASLALGVSLAENIPLPEHPRPDFERADWVNLNGVWSFGFAANSIDRKIVVPFGWGSKLSGVGDEGDTGYYRRTIRVPETWKGRRVFVVVGACDHDTVCTLDGKVLDAHVGGYTPFEIELTKFVKWGEDQTLGFRVWDPPADLATKAHYLYGKQGYGNARGIWQTVYLEARGKNLYLDACRFMPHVRNASVTARLTLNAPAAKPLVAKVSLDGKEHDVAFAAGAREAEAEIALSTPRLWDLDHPNLYDVTVSVADDVVKTYFGFREIGVGKNANGTPCVTLNGKPVYLQLCLDQSYHPDGWYTFPSDEVMKNEILISKRLALSGNRVHIKVEVPRKLYWADKLGLLIQADVPCAWGLASDAMFAEHWACFEDMVRRDFNHPCIYQWTLFNETWGLFGDKGNAYGKNYKPETQQKVADCYRKAKVLDPTRLVEDNSPCNWDHVATDVNTWHGYKPGYRWYDVITNACAQTYRGSPWNYVAGSAQGDQPMMNSECGNVWGYNGSTGDCDFTWDYHLMMNAFRSNLKCVGWLYTEHHDVINEWNGYVRFDRTPKESGFEELAGMTLADLHRDAAIIFTASRGRETGEYVPAGTAIVLPVGVSLVTDAYAGKKLTLSYTHGAKGAKTIVPGAFVAKSWQCETLWNVRITLPKEPAVEALVFTLSADGEPIAKNFWCYSTVDRNAAMNAPAKAEWSIRNTNVLHGLKYNGFGKGFFEFVLNAPAQGGLFRAELSAKRLNGKDVRNAQDRKEGDYMMGGGYQDRGKNPNSYPQTSQVKFPSHVRVFIDGQLAREITLPDDPADHRGILSWLSQPHDGHLYEAGSYGYCVTADVPASAVKGGKVTIRLEADHGLAVYGPCFGRYPFGPEVVAK